MKKTEKQVEDNKSAATAAPVETKQEAFRRKMNAHISRLNDRYRMMRKTLNSARPCQNDGELLCIAVKGSAEKFIGVINARVQEETEEIIDIFK